MTNLTAELECPNCHRPVRIELAEMVPGRSKPCPYCDATFLFSGDDGRSAQRGLDKLERSLKRLSRTLR